MTPEHTETAATRLAKLSDRLARSNFSFDARLGADIREVLEQLASARTELAQLRRDRDRLDKLDRLAAIRGHTWRVHVQGYGYLYVSAGENGEPIRQAIDSARVFEPAPDSHVRERHLAAIDAATATAAKGTP